MNSQFINRDLSWLSFNYRVLQEAMDKNVPLIERVRFLGIYSNNRDEFYRVRVALLKRMSKMERSSSEREDESPDGILEQIHKTISEQERLFDQTLRDLLKELEERHILLVDEETATKSQKDYAKRFYKKKLESFMFPIMLKNVRDSLFIKDGSIYLVVEMIGKKTQYAIVKIPHKKIGRFVRLPTEDRVRSFMFLDDVVRLNLKELFSMYDYHIFNAYTIRVTRDAEMDYDNTSFVSKTFFEQIKEGVHKRKSGQPVRFIYDGRMPEKMLQILRKMLKLSKGDHTKGTGKYHNMRDLMSFPVFSKHYIYKELSPLPNVNINTKLSLFANMRKKDILMHYPYQDFNTVIRVLKEASFDSEVVAINITLYRLASYSNIINSLVNALRNGKTVRVLLEAQARFDEAANLNLVKKLQDEGAQILPLIKDFKIHTKIFSIERKESHAIKYYSYIGTGNFNESTAKFYTDLGVLTYNQEIGEEINSIFRLIEYRFARPEYKHLVVSPFDTRKHYTRLINKEIENAKAGKKAWILAKMNSLADKEMTQKLYEASAAGVKIDLIVRGICILKAGIKNLSENIRVISIVDRFLEHSRVFVFCNDGNSKMYISSADWMVRNLDNRIEIAMPIYQQDLKDELMDVLNIQLNDNCKARIVNAENTNEYRKNTINKDIKSQIRTYKYYKNKLKK